MSDAQGGVATGSGGNAFAGAAGAASAGGSGSDGSGGTGGSGETGGSGTREPPSFVGYTGNAASKTGVKGRVNIGHEFTVTASGIRVLSLGVWDAGADGLTEAHTVTLFSLPALGLNPGAGAVPVQGGSVSVPAGTVAALDSGFRFADLASQIELEPGKYAVVAYGMNSAGDGYGDGGGVPYTGSGISDGGYSPYELSSALSPAFPNSGDQLGHATASFRASSSLPLFTRIMPLGASITDGLHGTDAGYRGPLYALLNEAHYASQFVGSSIDNVGSLPPDQRHHEGHSGFLIQGVQDNIGKWLGPTGSTADLVLLLVGTNDVYFNSDADLANAGKRMSTLLATICDKDKGLLPKARVIVAQLPPLKDSRLEEREEGYNAMLLQVVADHAKLGEKVSTVDMHSALTLEDLYTDGEHPVDSGYIKMAHVWFKAIVP